MNISMSAIGGAQRPDMTQMQRMPQMGKQLADGLGISFDQLVTGMRNGQSLNEVAAQHGVSQDQVIDQLATQLGQNMPAGAEGVDTKALAAQLADLEGGPMAMLRSIGGGGQGAMASLDGLGALGGTDSLGGIGGVSQSEDPISMLLDALAESDEQEADDATVDEAAQQQRQEQLNWERLLSGV
jgi:hypothetical protein